MFQIEKRYRLISVAMNSEISELKSKVRLIKVLYLTLFRLVNFRVLSRFRGTKPNKPVPEKEF